MNHDTLPSFEILEKSRSLRVGFLPVNDCAPLVMARELGLFAKYALQVELKREASWSVIQDKIIYGKLDAAHAPAAMPFAANLGCQTPRLLCVTGLILSLQGNAITLSRDLWRRIGNDAKALRQEILRLRGRRTHTFGVVFQFSSQNFLLRQWLKSIAIDPDHDVRIVMVPPTQLFPNLKLGYLDGYCVGEPWTSLAVEAGVGWCVTTSAELAPLHPEKALMVRREFAEGHAEEHTLLIAALIEACKFCDRPENREQVSRILAQRQYVNAPLSCLSPGMTGPFAPGQGHADPLHDFVIFSRYKANEPSPNKAEWIVGHLREMGALKDAALLQNPAVTDTFRPDIFLEARRTLLKQASEIDFETENYETQFLKRSPAAGR
jgi:ABC-type nitrate/sulfonate/bicarbonate transport system substrate-binding protein